MYDCSFCILVDAPPFPQTEVKDGLCIDSQGQMLVGACYFEHWVSMEYRTVLHLQPYCRKCSWQFQVRMHLADSKLYQIKAALSKVEFLMVEMSRVICQLVLHSKEINIKQ